MFPELPLERRLRLALDDLGLTEPTPVQREMVPLALQGVDLKVMAPTGSGKTFAYLIPLIQRLLLAPAPSNAGTMALVLVPTRELARQVLRQARKLIVKSPLKAQAVTGGADFRYQSAQFRTNPEILVATPGRLREHCEKRSADLSSVQTLVIDEADRMLEMGLREDVLHIAEHCAGQTQVMLLSATLNTTGLSALAESLLVEPQSVTIGEFRSPHSDIQHQLMLADSQAHKDQLLPALLQQSDSQRSLVFANRRSTATRLAQLLNQLGFKAACLHGDLSTEERKRVVTNFSAGKLDVITASDLAARGLDVPGIELVVNYELPRNGDDYLHRTGRTGRAGNKGLAVALVDASQWNLMISIQRYLNLEFERRSLSGLKARYHGPKKQKGSGKAAGPKTKPSARTAAKKKSRLRDQKNKGKPKSRSLKNDGFGPLMKPNKATLSDN